jgi:hypothetical protein
MKRAKAYEKKQDPKLLSTDLLSQVRGGQDPHEAPPPSGGKLGDALAGQLT